MGGRLLLADREAEEFVLVKSWMENNPYDQPEPPDFDGDVCCYEARSGSNGYTITPDYRKEGHPDDYLVFKGELGLDGWRSIFEAWKTNKIIAKVSFVPKSKPVPDMPEAETAYLLRETHEPPAKIVSSVGGDHVAGGRGINGHVKSAVIRKR